MEISSSTSTYYLLIALGITLFLLLVWIFFGRRRKKALPPSSFETSFKGLQPEKEPAEQLSEHIVGADSKPEPSQKGNWWSALAKTRERFFKLQSLEISALKEALEEACLISDLGVGNTQEALAALNWGELENISDTERLSEAKLRLSNIIRPWLAKSDGHSSESWLEDLERQHSNPKVIWFVGVNGVGKTTSIAKFAAELKKRGRSVLLAAGDTFRAAAGEQLEIWAQRLEVPCIRGQSGADSSAVLFDALESAKAKNIDYVLCDSAGRLHNQNQLMEALRKNRRVLEKSVPGAPHEVLLVLDANTGQNMINQAEQFIQSVGVTGLILTKLDGTARGGAVIAVARKTELPIRRLGLGETPEDFIAFDAERFSEALLGTS